MAADGALVQRAERPRGVYTGLTVVEFAEGPGAELAGKLLADLGAEVIKVEPPGGCASRRLGPFAGGEPDVNSSISYWHYNTSKKSVELDVDSPEGLEALHGLAARADVLLTSASLGVLRGMGLDYPTLKASNEKLIAVSITPFGLVGPWSDLHTSDLVNLALGGVLITCGYDDHTIPPIRPGGDQSYHTAASFAHSCLLAALIQRQSTQVGQSIDVSIHESVAVTTELSFLYWVYQETFVRRQTCRTAQPVPTQPTVFRCADGRFVYVMVILAEDKFWRKLVDWLGSENLAVDLADDRYLDLAYRQAHFGHIQEVLEVFCLLHDAETIYREGQARELPGVGMIFAPEELIDYPHLVEREFFVRPLDQPDGPLYPGAPYRFSAFDWAVTRPARLGEHTAAVLGGEAGG